MGLCSARTALRRELRNCATRISYSALPWQILPAQGSHLDGCGQYCARGRLLGHRRAEAAGPRGALDQDARLLAKVQQNNRRSGETLGEEAKTIDQGRRFNLEASARMHLLS